MLQDRCDFRKDLNTIYKFLHFYTILTAAHVWPVAESSLDWPVSPIWASLAAHLNTEREERRMQQSASHHIHWHCTPRAHHPYWGHQLGWVRVWSSQHERREQEIEDMCVYLCMTQGRQWPKVWTSYGCLFIVVRICIIVYEHLSENLNWGFQNYKVSHFISWRDQSEPSGWDNLHNFNFLIVTLLYAVALTLMLNTGPV